MDIPGVEVVAARRVGGGCICTGWDVTASDGRRLFAKTHPAPPPGFFAVEADGLRWLREGSGVVGPGVPEVVAVSDDVLVLEWLEAGGWWNGPFDERLGRAVAALHRAGAPQFGGPRDGYIGELPLPNGPLLTWSEFWVQRRILPVLRHAVDAGALLPGGAQVVERVCARAAELLGPPEPPARLHGDLWRGNVLAGADGRPWVVDPAAHGGHREVDLAMLDLFGGLSATCAAAYHDGFPLSEGWRDRLPLHQLHPLLVHAVLFGAGYGAQAVAAARRFA
ncbi:MAG: fructosamine kinase family protein [Acidimicrobiales bacterium]